MKNKKQVVLTGILMASIFSNVHADSFDESDLERWRAEYMSVVDEGEKLFHGGLGNENTVSCDQCHPNASNTHPETYPKFQKQIGRVVEQWEMINWCINNPLEANSLAADDPRMIALQAYIKYERRGVELAPGKH
ncbi:MAG TPA: cytochrome C [Gammaproteobacteria bacterium]|nr:cytochrome C [Gammaproteobacteria bacterium]